ncbi:sensor histidine kinase [Streptomyces erythrochromogenes]|uniref:sensor histidine kinase n=1 Tax=Streptomyces erythrochromogenes TaxID=285574 RepID=UPI00367648B0
MKLPTPYRVAAGLIYLSVGSLVGLLLAPLVVVALALRGLSWLLLVSLPVVVTQGLRALAAAARWAAGRGNRPPLTTALRTALGELPGRLAALREGFSFSLPLLRAIADLERHLAHSVVGEPGAGPPPATAAVPAAPAGAGVGAGGRERDAHTGWDDIGYLGLLLLGTVWLVPLAALAIPVVSFVVALPIGDPEQLAFGPGLTVVVSGVQTRLAVAAASVALFSGLVLLLFWMGRLRARMVVRILSRIDAAEAQWREAAAERQRIAALRVNDADYRRLERDLHDGAQARLAVLLMRLAHARRRKSDDAAYLAALVDETHQEISRALDEIRDLVSGIQPPILSDRGLDAAVTALTEKFHVPVKVRSSLERRPDVNVESTAYFIIAECLANTVKHASATAIEVGLEQDEHHLVVSVTDDGTGGASRSAGTGLRGLEDRATALGGRLDLSSPSGGPTVVTATLPWSVNHV